jgi:hypothetical protein
MKNRQQVARPCEKKGLDNYRPSSLCECLPGCEKLKSFLKPNSLGTINHLNNSDSSFSGCLELEDFLLKELLIRYETREVGGLEVLFEGIESIHNLNAEIFNDDYLNGEDLLSSVGMASFYLDSLENKVIDDVDNDKGLKGRFSDESLVSYFPDALGYAQSSTNALSSNAPRNLHDSFFISLYVQGEFDKNSDDLQNLATCFFHGVDSEEEIKKIWPRYTEARFQKLKSVIFARVSKKMPWWAKRFEKIWTKLSEPQIEAISLEWFYEEDEKPSQLENANQLGISVASYQERLDWAYKKLEDLYPELKRIKPSTVPAPLYLIRPNGEKEEIPFPVKKDKELSVKQKMLIRKCSKDKSLGNLIFRNQYKD